MMQRSIFTQIRRAVTVTSRSSLKCFSTVIEPSKTVVTMTTKPKVAIEYFVMTYYFSVDHCLLIAYYVSISVHRFSMFKFIPDSRYYFLIRFTAFFLFRFLSIISVSFPSIIFPIDNDCCKIHKSLSLWLLLLFLSC